MPPQRKIEIIPVPPVKPIPLPNPLKLALFQPDHLDCQINDQIYWANLDKNSHWPMLRRRNGSFDPNYFLEQVTGPDGNKRYEIAPQSTSATFSPGVAGEFLYVCLFHPQEIGVIVVKAEIFITANPQAGGPALYNINPLPPAVPTPLPVSVGVPIIWTNTDKQAHWPAPLDKNSNVDKTGFMSQAISPGTSSQPYRTKTAGTINYVCVLHKGESATLQIGEPE